MELTAFTPSSTLTRAGGDWLELQDIIKAVQTRYYMLDREIMLLDSKTSKALASRKQVTRKIQVIEKYR